jgi:acetyl-CoA acetyltransferase
VQVVYCREKLGIKFDVNGGSSISLGHSYGMIGARLVGHTYQGAAAKGQVRCDDYLRRRRHWRGGRPDS